IITCTPYAVNSHRLLVRGHAVPYTEAEAPAEAGFLGFDWTIQPWMWTRIAGAGGTMALLLLMSAGWIRDDHRARKKRAAQAAAVANSNAPSTAHAENPEIPGNPETPTTT
ncbi:MAG: hypothetical protein Q4G64_08855, partial [bacterium]|nr:hypothetical protein [bacterium]